MTDTTKTRLKYGLYGLLIISGLLIGGYIMPAEWVAVVTALIV